MLTGDRWSVGTCPPALHFDPVTDPGGDRPDLQILPYERREAHVREWDPRTADVAATIAAMVRRRRPDLVVEHIGSTAVPGLPGKGIVDLSVEVESGEIPGVVAVLYELGLGPQPGPDPWPPTRPMLVGAVVLEGEEFRIHLHVQPVGGDMPRDLAFRDALRNDPELMGQYAQLKTQITGGQGVDSLRYTHSKTAWILGVYKSLGFRVPAVQPAATIGILGGGRHARLIGLAALGLGYRVAVLDPDPMCPAASVADRIEVGQLDDIAAGGRLAAGCAVLTCEPDRADLELIRALDDGRVVLRPGPYALKLIHDPGAERRFLEANGAAVAPWRGLPATAQPRDAARGAGRAAAVELSVVVARGVDGVVQGYPIARTFRDRAAIVESSAPADIPAPTAALALALASSLATGMGLVGLLTAEVFLMPDGTLVVGGLVPGVDDGGLWSVEATATGQHEQHVRAICGLPLGSTDLRTGAAATVSLLGIGPEREARVRGAELAMEAPDVHLHLYGERRVGAGRKMGHVTATGATTSMALATARAAAAAIQWDETREAS
ncbi:MAG: ATP-grasp domain-containing protein [Chloroflexota bacterium]|nr:MAG: ATP-grasp domain-containing protein [Chloroflexota bacterium]